MSVIWHRYVRQRDKCIIVLDGNTLTIRYYRLLKGENYVITSATFGATVSAAHVWILMNFNYDQEWM